MEQKVLHYLPSCTLIFIQSFALVQSCVEQISKGDTCLFTFIFQIHLFLHVISKGGSPLDTNQCSFHDYGPFFNSTEEYTIVQKVHLSIAIINDQK